MTINRIDVEFSAVDGTKLAAWLYRPIGQSKRPPAVTMAHGFSATRFHGIDPVARAFAEAGFVVLLHDHRNFGGSGGEPRHDIDPWRQIEDWRQAISYLESLDYVDPKRIGAWGTSFSGGHAIVLGATDRRLKAVVTQVPTIVPRKADSYCWAMSGFRYRGREIRHEDILYIRTLIERYPNESRRKLSTRLCEAWQWRQSNGALRDMVCPGMLLMLERAGQIALPPVS